MRNKKVVRLTESQLHNIIAESVSQILEAWDDERMKGAMSNPRYKKMLDKIDPRTFARRVNGINAQGNRRSDDPKIMKNAAIRSFNNKYAKDVEDPKQTYTNRLHMYSNGKDNENSYGIHSYYKDWGEDESHAHGQDINLAHKYGQKDSVTHRVGQIGKNYREYEDDKTYHPYDSLHKDALSTARQMSGMKHAEYDPQKGWGQQY